MRKVSLLCLAVCLLSCGGGDFTNSEVAPDVGSPDVNVPDASDASDLETSSDVQVTPDTDVPDSPVEDTSSPDVDEETSTGCTIGELSCQGKTPTFCDENGVLQTKPDCPYLCVNGFCTGDCNPGTEQCSGKFLQACDSSGAWVTTQTCYDICLGDSCNEIWCCKEMTSPMQDKTCICEGMAKCQYDWKEEACSSSYNCCRSDGETCDCRTQPTQFDTRDCDTYITESNNGPYGTTYNFVKVDSCPQ